MTKIRSRQITYLIPAIAVGILFLLMPLIPGTTAIFDNTQEMKVDDLGYPDGYVPSEDPLVKLGFRPRFTNDGSQFIQTPEPMPEDAVMHPYGWTPNSLFSNPTRAEYTHYFDAVTVDVFVDTSSSGGGDLSSNEKTLLDRIIDDFLNYSWPRVKNYFDPSDKVDHVDFLVHKIDGPSGTGGYYQPGTDEFHLDRDDFSWGGIIAAHEFQHYVHRQYDSNENLWVDEGCADFGAYLVYGITSGIASHVYAYLNWAPRHSLVVDDMTFYYDSTTSYYGSSFLFQLYMIEHYGGKNYTHGLVKSYSNGIAGVDAGLAASGSSDRFEEAYSNWMVALSVNDDYAGDGTTYSYSQKTYSNGQIRLPITKSHSGTPVDSSLSSNSRINSFGVNSIRFTSPPESDETYRLKLSYTAGSPIAALYFESDPPRSVIHLDFGSSRTKIIDLDDWGTKYSSFRLITSSTAESDLNYELDILDLVPPVSEFSISPKLPDGIDGWYVTSPQVTLASEAAADIYYRLNSGEEQKYSQPFFVPEGIWNISFHAVDRHDNIESLRYFDVKVDTSSPSSSIVVEPDMPDDTWYTSPPMITLNTAHPNTIIEYKFGNGDYQEYDVSFSPPEGISTLFWRSVDQAGNEEDEKSRSFRIDTIPPSLEYSFYPYVPDGKNGFYRTSPSLSISSEDGDAIYYSIDDGDLLVFMGPVTIPDGEHTIKMLPIDKAGNRGEEVRVEVKVDTETPSIQGMFEGWEYDRGNSSDWITVAPTLDVAGSEEGMTINYSINGGLNQQYERPIQINEGITEIWIHAEDDAGNQAEPVSYFFKVDLKIPFVEPVVSEEPQNGWYQSSSVEVDLKLLEEDDRSSPVKIEYQWSGGETEIYRNPISVPEGKNTLLYWATDAAGNRMETRSLDFKKDSTLPGIGLDIPELDSGIIQAGSKITVNLSSSEDENGIGFYSVDFLGMGDLDWSLDPLFTYVYAAPGTYNITGYVKDAAGNIREKTKEIVIAPADIKDPNGDGDDDENGSSSMIFAVIGAVVLLLILVAVLAVVLVRSRSHHSGGATQVNHHPHHANHHIMGHNNGIQSGVNIPPPPSPPGDITGGYLE
jgi:hypothetical protein